MGRTSGGIAWLAACVALMLGAAPVRAQTADEFDGVARERIVSDIDRSIRRHFAHWQGTAGLNYDETFAAYRAAALAAPDRRAFSVLSEAFVARLQNGHSFFLDPEISRGDPGAINLTFAYVEGQWVVRSSSMSAVPAGSVVTGVDDLSVEALYRRAATQISASSDRARRSRFGSPHVFPVQFTLHLADGSAVPIDRTVRGDRPSVAPPPPVFARWEAPGVAYLRVRGFDNREYEAAAVASMRGEYAAARTVIIDVRGNGGGNTPDTLGRLLLGRDWRFWRTSPPREPVTAAPRVRPATPKYIVLVDRYCASACEDFVMPFSISAQAVLVGEATMGTSGQPQITHWDNGMSLWVSRRRQWFPNDGREFEGVGVGPDMAITLRPADFANGAPDRTLDCARAIALSAMAECPA